MLNTIQQKEKLATISDRTKNSVKLGNHSVKRFFEKNVSAQPSKKKN